MVLGSFRLILASLYLVNMSHGFGLSFLRMSLVMLDLSLLQDYYLYNFSESLESFTILPHLNVQGITEMHIVAPY